MRFVRLALIATMSVAVLAPFDRAASQATQPPKANRCAEPAFRQFDFWVGNWRVTDRASGQFAGRNDVTREYGGCVVQEHWVDASGSRGSSFNIYDKRRRQWHQTWVDDNGLYLDLSGTLRDGAMVLAGTRPGKAGGRVIDRITWTPQRDGSVRQWWRVSADGGKTWTTSFDGIYRRV